MFIVHEVNKICILVLQWNDVWWDLYRCFLTYFVFSVLFLLISHHLWQGCLTNVSVYKHGCFFVKIKIKII